MRIDKPIFCFQINSELHKHLGLTVNAEVHRRYLRSSILSTVMPHYASHAQVIECFHDCPALVAELSELAQAQHFVSLSRQPNITDFIETRKRMYDWDRRSYPMYFNGDLGFFRSLPTVSQGDPSTTSALRKIYATLYRDAPPAFENRLALGERRILEANASSISRFVVAEEGALTSAYFRRVPNLQNATGIDVLLSKTLPAQFANIYLDVFEGFTATGMSYLSYFEDERSFPYLDHDIVMSLFVKLGIQNLVLDSSPDGIVNLLAFRNHNNFPEFVRAKDNLLYLMAKEQPRSVSIERHGFLSKVRGLGLNQLGVDALKDPSIAAIAVYRAAEELCRIEPATAKRKSQMPDALSWKGKYLIVTATDIEDHELQAALTARGFSPPVIENEDRFTFITRFRSDVGRVFHLRTSAGSGGASGATIMGKNAIDVLKPESVISVGICFGLREKDQQLGDVVVSEMIHDYERERVSETRPEDRGATREAGPILLSRARANSIIWTKAPLHFGTIASGEKLVDDENLREKLKALQPNPIAGDMEAWGLSAVCHESQKQFIMVKGICDWGFNKTKDHQQVAAKNACDFVLDALVV